MSPFASSNDFDLSESRSFSGLDLPHDSIRPDVLMLYYRKRIERYGQLSRPIILHYDPVARDLRPWLWPSDNQKPITPPNFYRHRETHNFRGPCCLCALTDGAGALYTEAAVFRAFEGPFFGEYMIGCAKGECGYLISVERMHATTRLPLQEYLRRYVDDAVPDVVIHVPSLEMIAIIASENLAQAKSGRRMYLPDIPIQEPHDESPFVKLMQLDSFENPGLPEAEVTALLTKCRRCHFIMTCEAFHHHKCGLASSGVIDLTVDD